MRLLLTAALLCLALGAQAQDCSVKLDYTPWIPTRSCERCSSQTIDQWQLQQWANEARDEIKRAVDERRLINLGQTPCWTLEPVVLPVPCEFWMRGTYYYNHTTQRYESGDVCAVGTTEFAGYRVVISLAYGNGSREHIKGIVQTETRNVYLQWMRRYDMIDRWTPTTVDPYAALQKRARAIRSNP